MKCIYCNDESNLTVSDIIPAALTGAKLRKRFVCGTHNAFTNDHYEKEMIRQLDIFRNLIGLTERDGDPVRYSANLMVGDYVSEKEISISDNKSVMDSDRIFRMKDKQGRIVLVGPKEKLLKIKGATEEEISDLLLEDIAISSKANIRDLFIAESILHAVSKIAYEWHCWVNGIEEFHQDRYDNIVAYILNPEQENTVVEIVKDYYVKELSDRFSRMGSNMLFEYNDSDGYTYVLFSLWNVIIYKIKICRHGEKNTVIQCPTAYFYHADGSRNDVIFGMCGEKHVNAMSAARGIEDLCQEIRMRLSRLGERDLSKEYLNSCIQDISKKLISYRAGKASIADLLDFEHKDRIIPIYILEQLYEHRDEYLIADDFYQNMRRILKTDECFNMTKEMRDKIMQRYVDMDANDTFIHMLMNAICFFESI